MRGFLLGTEFCLACLRREVWALKALRSVSLEEVAVSSVTASEIAAIALSGAATEREARGELAKVDAFLRPIRKLAFDSKEARLFAATKAFMLACPGGPCTKDRELMELATAESHRLVMVVGSTKDLAVIKPDTGLVVWKRTPPLRNSRRALLR